MTTLLFLVVFSVLSFLFFGISCFITHYMRTEFMRYGLKNLQYLIGALQLIGAFGLGLGYFYMPIVAVISAIGLSLLMILGFAVRLKIKDTVIQSAPSLFYAIINCYIAISILQSV